MKDATGELSMTAVAVVAIAGIAGLFGTLVYPQIKANITRNTRCSQAYNCVNCDGKTCICTVPKIDDDSQTEDISCPDENH